MGDTGVADSPLESAADATGAHTIRALKLLGDEARLAILLALWEAYDPNADDDALSFSELRERVGLPDSGQFNYHLKKLEGHFVRKTDDGYELQQAGRTIVQALISGTGLKNATLEPTEIDVPCEYCGRPTAITYEHGRVYQICTECQGDGRPGDEHPRGALVGWTFEPTGLSNRTAEEVFAASTVKNYARIAVRFESICPGCSGPVEYTLQVCEDHEPAPGEMCPNCQRQRAIVAQEVCTICKSSGVGPPSLKVMMHPAVVAFYYDHGIEFGFTGNNDFASTIRNQKLVSDHEQELVSTEPLRVRVTIRYEGDELHLTLDEELNVIDVSK